MINPPTPVPHTPISFVLSSFGEKSDLVVIAVRLKARLAPSRRLLARLQSAPHRAAEVYGGEGEEQGDEEADDGGEGAGAGAVRKLRLYLGLYAVAALVGEVGAEFGAVPGRVGGDGAAFAEEVGGGGGVGGVYRGIHLDDMGWCRLKFKKRIGWCEMQRMDGVECGMKAAESGRCGDCCFKGRTRQLWWTTERAIDVNCSLKTAEGRLICVERAGMWSSGRVRGYNGRSGQG